MSALQRPVGAVRIASRCSATWWTLVTLCIDASIEDETVFEFISELGFMLEGGCGAIYLAVSFSLLSSDGAINRLRIQRKLSQLTVTAVLHPTGKIDSRKLQSPVVTHTLGV